MLYLCLALQSIVVAALLAAGVGVWLYRRKKAPSSPKTFSKRKRDLPDDVSDPDTFPDMEMGSGPPTTDPDGSGG